MSSGFWPFAGGLVVLAWLRHRRNVQRRGTLTISEPDGATPQTPIVVVFHGHNQHAIDWAQPKRGTGRAILLTRIHTTGAAAVFPQAPTISGEPTWTEAAAKAALAEVQALGRPVRAVVGFSQGGGAAVYAAAMLRVPVFVSSGTLVAYPRDALAAVSGVRVAYFYREGDQKVPAAAIRDMIARLRSLGATVVEEHDTGSKHEVTRGGVEFAMRAGVL